MFALGGAGIYGITWMTLPGHILTISFGYPLQGAELTAGVFATIGPAVWPYTLAAGIVEPPVP